MGLIKVSKNSYNYISSYNFVILSKKIYDMNKLLISTYQNMLLQLQIWHNLFYPALWKSPDWSQVRTSRFAAFEYLSDQRMYISSFTRR